MREGAIPRAVATIRDHPEVRSATHVEGTIYEVSLNVGLASQWVSRGVSPTGVLAVEKVHFEFPDAYPLKAPTLTLREDFNQNLPHINPFERGERIPPCIVDGDPNEFHARRGILGVVDQLLHWLENAATGDLIAQEQGWEPARRDSVSSLLVADRSRLTNARKPKATPFGVWISSEIERMAIVPSFEKSWVFAIATSASG